MTRKPVVKTMNATVINFFISFAFDKNTNLNATQRLTGDKRQIKN